jgi:glycosyltransferase involved in cell wall biosynthesis/GT2 family glycosyltransferase
MAVLRGLGLEMKSDQQVIASNSSYRSLIEQFNDLREQAEEWRQIVVQRDRDVAEIQELQSKLSASEEAVRAQAQELASLRRSLSDILHSTSWRLTAPLRGLAIRHPNLFSRLRRWAASNHRLIRNILQIVRVTYRIATLRSFLPDARIPTNSEPEQKNAIGAVEGDQKALASPIAPRVQEETQPSDTSKSKQPAASFLKAQPKRIWFFLGDTIEWLASAQLTGIGRVSVELFLASVEIEGVEAIPCALASDRKTLASLSLSDSVAYLAARSGSQTAVSFRENGAATRAPETAFTTVSGDHVLFTGVVWSAEYVELFGRLAANGVRFSVFVYDLIPLENPEFVSAEHNAMFGGWLRTVLCHAEIIFVSSLEIRDRILRWAAIVGIVPAASIVAVPFGVRRLETGAAQQKRGRLRPDVRWSNFVLCVGTIDLRKNQLALCTLWARLDVALKGGAPQLVLVGRDDLKISSKSNEVAGLMQSGTILVLEGIENYELAELYERCLFTVFPSLSEGYGLPVAESLAHGKLCIASDLAVIRDHAGELPWYVPVGDDEALFEAIHRAIAEPEARAETEKQIVQSYEERKWTNTWHSMCLALKTSQGVSVAPPTLRPRDIVDIPRVPVRRAMEGARRWCTEAAPDVSIIILNRNAAELTMECVRHIWANTEEVQYEIIIVDNGSDPASLRQLQQLGRGVRLIELGANCFFGEASNIAVEHAQGRYICLLSNDAFVQPCWLSSLMRTLEADTKAGAAGPIFLFPNGSIHEAGGSIDATGVPHRAGPGQKLDDQYVSGGVVDYIPAATLLVRKDCFLEAGGFDLAYEPTYYEDVDLCFKLRALGRAVILCPESRVVHVEGAAVNDDPTTIARRTLLGELNRDKFLARWSGYLKARRSDTLQEIATRILPHKPSSPAIVPQSRQSVLFTPFALTPGGGERVLLTLASILSENYRTSLITSHPCSYLRLLNLARDLDLDLDRCELSSIDQLLTGPIPDIQITIGNHIVPPIQARGKNSFYICQFPFPMPVEQVREQRRAAESYKKIITYTEYVRAHALAAQSAHQMPSCPIEVIPPPVPQYRGRAEQKRRMVLTVGRFFTGAHAKRHDLLIEAFRRLLERVDPDVEMHICGASTPEPIHMEYLIGLQRKSEDLPITFHVNATHETLARLYREAALYWHGTGLGASLPEHPEQAEHFGITPLEAMSAGCVPLVFNAGGPRETVTHGLDGILYNTLDELVEYSAELLVPGRESKRVELGRAATLRAAEFDLSNFRRRIDRLLSISLLRT